MVKQVVDDSATFASERDVAEVTAAAQVIKDYMRRELIVEECRVAPCFGCVSCNAVDLERRLDSLIGLF